MNWETGLRRLWVVASLGWVAWYFYVFGAVLPQMVWQEPLRSIGWFVGPILAANVAVNVLIWIIDGFRIPRRPSLE